MFELIVSQGRIADRKERTIEGALQTARMLEDALGLKGKYFGTPEPAKTDDWTISLPGAKQTLVCLQRAISDRTTVDKLLCTVTKPTNSEGHRAAPSAHALYPLSFLVTSGDVDGLNAGIYGFETDTSELLCKEMGDRRGDLRAAAVDDQHWIEAAPFIITICGNAGLVAQHFSDQFPFGGRGERYMYLEAGAVAQTLLLTALSLDLGGVLVAGYSDEKTADILGLAAPHMPLCHLCFGRQKTSNSE